MRPGLLLLIIGLVLAGVGAAAWVFVEPYTTFWFLPASAAQMIAACGVIATIVGGGLAVGGIIRMILGGKE